MPKWLKPQDEPKWERAKLIVNSSIKRSKSKLRNVKKDSDRYYRLVMGTFKAIKSGKIKM